MNFGSLNSLNNLRAGELPAFNPRSIRGTKLLLDSSVSSVYSDSAVQFTAVDKSYLSVANNATLTTGDVDFEIGRWVYLDTTSGVHVIHAKYDGGAAEYYLIYSGGFKFAVYKTGTGATELTSTFGVATVSTWYFVRAWHNSGANTLNIQINNGTIDSVAYAVGVDSTASSVTLGASTGITSTFNSFREDSGYWTKTISSTVEVTALYNAGAGRRYADLTSTNGLGTFATNLISWWDFSEEDGIRYDQKGTNHLLQTFTNIIDSTTPLLNGGFETAGTNGGLISGTRTSTRARATNVATIVTGTAHGLVNGNVATISGMTDTTFNATSVTVTRIDDTTFTYANTGSDVGSGADTGGYVKTPVFDTNWVISNAGGGLTTNEGTIVKTGTHALKLTQGTPASGNSCYQALIVVAGQKRKFSFWTRGDGTYSGRYGVYDATNAADIIATTDTGVIGTTYTLVTVFYTVPAGCTSVQNIFYAPGTATGSAYFDTVTLVSTEIRAMTGIATGLAVDGNLCASLNGTTQYLSKTSNASLQTGDIDFEVGGWVNMSSTTYADIMSKWLTTGDKREYSLFILSAGTPSFAVTSDGEAATTVLKSWGSNFLPNQWYFVRAYHDSVNNLIGIQVDGGTAVTQATSAGVAIKDAPLTVGQAGSNGPFPGRLDGMYFRKQISTPTEVTQLINGGKGLKYAALPASFLTGLVSYWNLDEYSAGTSNVTRLDSVTASANNLTSSGNTPSGQGVNYYEGTVSKWVDQSGSATNVIQTTQANRLMYVTNAQNGNPVLRGDGLTKTLYNTADLLGTGNITICVVVKPRGVGGAGNGRIIDNSKFILSLPSAYVYVSNDGTVTIAQSAAASITLGTAYVIIVTRTSAKLVNIYINGVLSGTADQDAGTISTGSPTYIGNNSALARGFDGDIDEIAVYSSILTVTQIKTLTSYLKTRWGIV